MFTVHSASEVLPTAIITHLFAGSCAAPYTVNPNWNGPPALFP
jgi:hypothetical protein